MRIIDLRNSYADEAIAPALKAYEGERRHVPSPSAVDAASDIAVTIRRS